MIGRPIRNNEPKEVEEEKARNHFSPFCQGLVDVILPCESGGAVSYETIFHLIHIVGTVQRRYQRS
jgi:hypothetical protein